MRRSITATILLFLTFCVYGQTTEAEDDQDNEHEVQSEFMLSLANNHMLLSRWSPYENQLLFDISYLWKFTNHKITFDTGLSMSFDFNECAKCVSAANSNDITYDAAIISARFGIGKWWIKEKASIFLVSGGLLAFSTYREYFPSSTVNLHYFQDTNRSHAGLYAKFGINWKVGRGFETALTSASPRLGPFIETKISTGQTRQDLYLNINSIAVGLMFGLQVNK